MIPIFKYSWSFGFTHEKSTKNWRLSFLSSPVLREVWMLFSTHHDIWILEIRPNTVSWPQFPKYWREIGRWNRANPTYVRVMTLARGANLKQGKIWYWSYWPLRRSDPIVIRLVQLYGKVAILTPLFQAARIMLYSEDPHLGGIVYGIKRSWFKWLTKWRL
jgi:hypothetical protein